MTVPSFNLKVPTGKCFAFFPCFDAVLSSRCRLTCVGSCCGSFHSSYTVLCRRQGSVILFHHGRLNTFLSAEKHAPMYANAEHLAPLTLPPTIMKAGRSVLEDHFTFGAPPY